jgi:hypothetical protein
MIGLMQNCFLINFNNFIIENKINKCLKKKHKYFLIYMPNLKKNISHFLNKTKKFENVINFFLKNFLHSFLNKILILNKKFYLFSKKNKLFWFRLELRIKKNKLLKELFDFPDDCILLICLDCQFLKLFGPKRKKFLNETIGLIKKNLKKKKIKFIFQIGCPEEIISNLTKLFSFQKILLFYEKNIFWKNSPKKEKILITYLSSITLNLEIFYPNLAIFSYYIIVFYLKNLKNGFFFFLKNIFPYKIKKIFLKKFRKNFFFLYSYRLNKNTKKINLIPGEEFSFFFFYILRLCNKDIFLFNLINKYYSLKPWLEFGCIVLNNFLNFYFQKKLKMFIFLFFNLLFGDFQKVFKLKKANLIFF